MPEKFLYELVSIDNHVVQSRMMMTERSAEESNEWLSRQTKRFEWRKSKSMTEEIDDFTKEKV